MTDVTTKCAWCNSPLHIATGVYHPDARYYCSPECELEGDYHYERRELPGHARICEDEMEGYR